MTQPKHWIYALPLPVLLVACSTSYENFEVEREGELELAGCLEISPGAGVAGGGGGTHDYAVKTHSQGGGAAIIEYFVAPDVSPDAESMVDPQSGVSVGTIELDPDGTDGGVLAFEAADGTSFVAHHWLSDDCEASP